MIGLLKNKIFRGSYNPNNYRIGLKFIDYMINRFKYGKHIQNQIWR